MQNPINSHFNCNKNNESVFKRKKIWLTNRNVETQKIVAITLILLLIKVFLFLKQYSEDITPTRA